MQLYEIHCYHEDVFQYVVASTNKFSEEKVRKDVEQMNNMLNDHLKAKGIRYVFALGTDSVNGQKKKQKRDI